MITINLAGDMGLYKVREINAQLMALPGTEFTRRTYTWTSPATNLEAVTAIGKAQPISFSVK